jgi:hypothetical protein
VVDRDLRQDSCLGGRAGPVTSLAAMMEQSINFPSSTQQEGRKNTGANTEWQQPCSQFEGCSRAMGYNQEGGGFN